MKIESDGNMKTIKCMADASKFENAIKEIEKLKLKLGVDIFNNFAVPFFDGLVSFDSLLRFKYIRTKGTSAFYSIEPSDCFLDFLKTLNFTSDKIEKGEKCLSIIH